MKDKTLFYQRVVLAQDFTVRSLFFSYILCPPTKLQISRLYFEQLDDHFLSGRKFSRNEAGYPCVDLIKQSMNFLKSLTTSMS